MVRLLIRISAFFTFLLAFSQQARLQTVFGNYQSLIWYDEFDQGSNTLWKQTTNADEIMIVQNGEYLLYRKNKQAPAIVYPNEKISFGNYKAEFSIRLEDDNSKSATAGAMVMAQEDGRGAFLIEINGKKEYRVSKYNGVKFTPVTEGDEGWVKEKILKGRGEFNTISVSTENKKYDLYLNGKFVNSFSEVTYKAGKVGFYVGPDVKMAVDYVRIFVTEDEYKRQKQQEKKEKEAQEDPVLTEVVKRLRQQVKTLEAERDSLLDLVKELKRNGGGGTGSDQKLRRENADLKAEVDRLKKENATLAKENTDLKKFKETIKNNENGDIIINLTEAIETERQRVEILAAENESLTEEIKKLKGKD